MARPGCVHINATVDDLNWSATGSLDRFYSSLLMSTGVPAYALTGRRDALRNQHQAMAKLRKFGQTSSQVFDMLHSSVMLATKNRQIPLDDLEHALCLNTADKDVKIDQGLNEILTDAPSIHKAAAYLSPLGSTQLMQTLQRTLRSELPYVCFGYTGFEERCKELLLKLRTTFDYIWAVKAFSEADRECMLVGIRDKQKRSDRK